MKPSIKNSVTNGSIAKTRCSGPLSSEHHNQFPEGPRNRGSVRRRDSRATHRRLTSWGPWTRRAPENSTSQVHTPCTTRGRGPTGGNPRPVPGESPVTHRTHGQRSFGGGNSTGTRWQRRDPESKEWTATP